MTQLSRGYALTLAAVGVLALAASASAARKPTHAAAAPIHWSAPVNETGAATDIDTSGAFFASVGSVKSATINGVTFEDHSSRITLHGLNLNYTGHGYVPKSWSHPDQGYATLVQASGWAMGKGQTITLSGLVPRHRYLIQIFEPTWDYNWTTTYSAGGKSSDPVFMAGVVPPGGGAPASDTPQYVTGTFTAAGSTETITLGSPTGGVVFSAAQVRDLGMAAR
jgi:hypothetical protein